jgi:hypothetical protein
VSRVGIALALASWALLLGGYAWLCAHGPLAPGNGCGGLC